MWSQSVEAKTRTTKFMRGLFSNRNMGLVLDQLSVLTLVVEFFLLETLFKSERVMEAIFHCFFENYISKSSSDHWKSVVDVLGGEEHLKSQIGLRYILSSMDSITLFLLKMI